MAVQAEGCSNLADFIFIEVLERFHEAEVQVFGEAAHVVVALYDALVGERFGDIGPYRALGQPFGVPDLTGFVGEDVDEGLAYGFALEFGVGDALAGGEEAVCGAYALDVQAHSFVVPEHVLEFILAKQAVVHEYADKAVAYGFVHQKGGDSGVHTAGKAQHYDVIPHLGLDGRDCIRDELRHIDNLTVIHN